MDKLVDGLIAVLTAVVGLAVVAVIFSRGGQTAQVVTASGNAFSSIIKSAVSPVS
ncbi:MAG: hypothetical protein KGJ13_06525 [Patescibacteria group bacterium]|nr:hypothetical protein [Patescibacteria group bacterium]